MTDAHGTEVEIDEEIGKLIGCRPCCLGCFCFIIVSVVVEIDPLKDGQEHEMDTCYDGGDGAYLTNGRGVFIGVEIGW